MSVQSEALKFLKNERTKDELISRLSLDNGDIDAVAESYAQEMVKHNLEKAAENAMLWSYKNERDIDVVGVVEARVSITDTKIELL